MQIYFSVDIFELEAFRSVCDSQSNAIVCARTRTTQENERMSETNIINIEIKVVVSAIHLPCILHFRK